MGIYHIFKSVVNNKIFCEFQLQRGVNLMNHSANSTSIEDFLAIAYVLCPDFIEVNGYIFLSDFYNAYGDGAINKLEKLERQFGRDKRKIEQYVNSWSFGDFFIGQDTPSMDNENILKQFGEILIYYWTRRAKELFRNKNIIVTYGVGLMGELGYAVTLYEDA